MNSHTPVDPPQPLSINSLHPIPRMAVALANDPPPQKTRARISPWTLAGLLAVLLVIGGSVWIYQTREVDQETYKALIIEAGPWCGGGQLLRTPLQSDDKITRWEARQIREVLTTLQESNRKCVDPFPEPVVKEGRKKK